MSGWAAVDVLQAQGVTITPDIMRKVFPAPTGKANKKAAHTADIKRINPSGKKPINVLGIVREFERSTKRTQEIHSLGDIGKKFLGLQNTKKLWQLTLVMNSERPNLSYTCVAPDSFQFLQKAKNQMAFARLRPGVMGDVAIWIVEQIDII